MSALEYQQRQEQFWDNVQKNHCCTHCGSHEEQLYVGLCIECKAKSEVRFVCLGCHQEKSFLEFAANAIYCLECQAKLDERDAAVEEDIEFFNQILMDSTRY